MEKKPVTLKDKALTYQGVKQNLEEARARLRSAENVVYGAKEEVRRWEEAFAKAATEVAEMAAKEWPQAEKAEAVPA